MWGTSIFVVDGVSLVFALNINCYFVFVDIGGDFLGPLRICEFYTLKKKMKKMFENTFYSEK